MVVFQSLGRADSSSGARHGLALHTAGGSWVWCGADRVVGWSFVENCTVDASIFVVKLSRANGGCLGTRSR
jgi:hypothetical protein